MVAVALLAGIASASAKPIRIVALGDSLTAGFGLPAGVSFADVLEKRLRQAGLDVQIANAGVSGDTTTGGLARLDWSVPDTTDLVIVELGANDMLRAVAPSVSRKALDDIVRRLQERHIAVVLAGMKSLANWGEPYRRDFEGIYPDLATKYDVPLYPFFLEGVAGQNDFVLPDGLHPNSRGVQKIVDGFTPFLAPILAARFAETTAPAKQ
jgi:acyl-CoA thioesterase I